MDALSDCAKQKINVLNGSGSSSFCTHNLSIVPFLCPHPKSAYLFLNGNQDRKKWILSCNQFQLEKRRTFFPDWCGDQLEYALREQIFCPSIRQMRNLRAFRQRQGVMNISHLQQAVSKRSSLLQNLKHFYGEERYCNGCCDLLKNISKQKEDTIAVIPCLYLTVPSFLSGAIHRLLCWEI